MIKMGLKKIGTLAIAFMGILASAQNSKLADLVTEFEADNWALNRTYNVHESEEYYQRFKTFYADWEKKMAALDFDGLSQQGKVDYVMYQKRHGVFQMVHGVVMIILMIVQ